MSGNRTIVEYETMSGVVLHITPLSLKVLQSLQTKAAELYPFPDKEPYEAPLKNAIDPSIKRDAMENPEYKALYHDVDRQQAGWIQEQALELAIEFRDYAGNRQGLIEYFAPQLNNLRKRIELPEDDYRAIWEYLLFSGNDDRLNVVRIVYQRMPLTGGEVADAMRLFRPDVSRPGTRKGDSGASGLQRIS